MAAEGPGCCRRLASPAAQQVSSRAPQPPHPAAPPPPSMTEDAHSDDHDADDALDTAGLLSERLGAQVIEEIPHN